MDHKSLLASDVQSSFKAFHELMAIKVREILLVSSLYDAFILEEDGSLASRIINEYSGLNLSQPPRVTRTSSAYEALQVLNEKKFDMVITMPHLDDMDAFSLAQEIKKQKPGLPVILLAHSMRSVSPPPEHKDETGIDKVFVWSGNSDLLLALVKNTEDRINIGFDTQKAGVRVMILVEDSPIYYSSFLPLIYKEIVKQTQAVLEVGLNEEHRLLLMRARPKILHAESLDEAMSLYRRYRQFLFGVISDTRLPMAGRLEEDAGHLFLSTIRKEIPDLPLLLLSSEPKNREMAERIPAVFLDKNSPYLLSELHDFFLHHLGFGDFVFLMPDGSEVGRASNLRELEDMVSRIPEESLWYHGTRNHFSRWIMARSEFTLASAFREVRASDFRSADEARQFLISNIHALRKWRQRGVVAQFRAPYFDPDVMDFVKIGQGSLGGKARSLAFMSSLLQERHDLHERHRGVNVSIPKTLVICTDGFYSFVEENDLHHLAKEGFTDEEVRGSFLRAKMPEWLTKEIETYAAQIKYPLSVRSSSLLEDAQFQPYAGLYQTYMIPNNHPETAVRLRHLVTAIKLVYASTYCEGPKSFSRSLASQPQEEAMAVVIQQIGGARHGDFFYPTLAGVAQSHNFYPIPPMKTDEGIAQIALGLGRTVVEGERALRFSPRYPQILPQFSSVDDILANAQRTFYALRIRDYPEELSFGRYSNLEKRDLEDAEEEAPVKILSSTYIPEEHRLRDGWFHGGHKVLTFASVLKHRVFPLPELLDELLDLCRKGMGCPIEMEFSANLNLEKDRKGDFFFLQMRPMVVGGQRFEIRISREEISKAVCYSTQALGHGENREVADIVYVKPERFRLESTVEIAGEIGLLNGVLAKEKRRYLLIGPGRWGSADRWLGIPVQWKDISGVGAIIELRNERLKADSSQGSHFFLNITSLGIPYLTVSEGSEDHLRWEWLERQPPVCETRFLRHVRFSSPLIIRLDSATSQCVILGDG